MNDPEIRLAKTYVWHAGKCYFISTINRDSSAMDGPRRYAETLVWEYDWEKRERGELLFQDEGSSGSTWKHFKIAQALRDQGEEYTGDPE